MAAFSQIPKSDIRFKSEFHKPCPPIHHQGSQNQSSTLPNVEQTKSYNSQSCYRKYVYLCLFDISWPSMGCTDLRELLEELEEVRNITLWTITNNSCMCNTTFSDVHLIQNLSEDRSCMPSTKCFTIHPHIITYCIISALLTLQSAEKRYTLRRSQTQFPFSDHQVNSFNSK